jgi:predicted Fe-Mo cluster-binding NifX family protein
MKIAITSRGKNRHSAVDSRFGRANYLILYDQAKDSWDCLPHTQNLDAALGAGIQTFQTLLKTGVSVLITGYISPKAFKVLDAAKIRLYSFGDRGSTVEEALTAYLNGKLNPIITPNALDIKK